MNRRTWLLTGLLVLAFALALVGPGITSDEALAQQGAFSRVRFLHAVPGAPDVDVYFDGALVASGLSYGSVTPHLNVPGGEHQVALRQGGTGAGSPVLIEVPVPLVPDLAFMVVAQGSPSALQAALYEDILDELEPGMARLTAINAIADSPSLDMLTSAGGPLLQGVSYGAQFGTVNIGSSLQNLVMVPAGGAVESAVAQAGQVSLQSGTMYTFVALGTLDGAVAPSVLTLETPVNGSAESVQVRIAHGSPDAPAVDVYANDLLIVPSLALGEMSGHIPLPAGSYTLALRPAGQPLASDPVATAVVTLEASTPALTIAATGNVGDGTLALTAFPDGVANIAPNMARIAVINAVPGSTASVMLVDAAQTVLANDLAVGQQSAAVDVAVGEQMLTVRVTVADAPVDLIVPAQDYFGGMYYNVLVYGGGPDALPFDARVAGTEILVTIDSLLPAGALAAVAVVEAPPAEVVPTEAPAAPSAVITEEPPAEAAPAEVQPAAASELVVDAQPPAEAAPPAEAPESGAQFQQPTSSPDDILATVQLDPGANLQCREYPNSEARSMGLIPSGETVVVIGRTGEPELPETGNPTPEPTPVVETINDLWVSVRWDQPNGGYIRCWTAARYMLFEYKGKFLLELEDLLEALPEEPFNRPGEAVGASEQPPTPIYNAVLATVNLEPGVSLQLRRYPDPNAEVLERVPAQAQMEVLAVVEAPTEGLVGQPTNPYWIYVRYRQEFGSSTVGWVSAEYIFFTHLDRYMELEDLVDLQVPFIETSEIEPGFYEEAGQPPQLPLEMQDVIGIVTLNPGANLNLRDRPAVDGIVILGIPSGEFVVLNGRSGDGTWVQVTYETDTGPVNGWTASQYLTVTRGGQPWAIKDLEILTGEADTME
ncbi:MAG: DUF4397 domain-containing protein [Anaerolineae bacterium]|nr:DUF4397 domain-containing protein [Anaerolineae bacterium]